MSKNQSGSVAMPIPAVPGSASVFIARQPIFDRLNQVCAYELLFRSGPENVYPHADGDRATLSVIYNSLMVFTFQDLAGGKPAFINFTREALLNGHAYTLPVDQVVIEILETVEPDQHVLQACRKLRDAGYKLALDDVFCGDQLEGFLDVADIVKVDLRAASADAQRELCRIAAVQRKQCLAEKVETREEYAASSDVGFDYFQGYFFSRPAMLSGTDVQTAQLQSLGVLKDSLRADLDTRRFETIIKRDVALTYKLLRYINAPAFAFRSKITSLKHALDMLGIEGVQRWLTLVLLHDMGTKQSRELIVAATVRARFCERLADWLDVPDRAQDLFLLGLLSVLDSLLGRPMAELVADLPIPDDVKGALLGTPNPLKEALDLVLAYEQAEWGRISEWTAARGLPEDELPALYRNALRWADSLASVGKGDEGQGGQAQA